MITRRTTIARLLTGIAVGASGISVPKQGYARSVSNKAVYDAVRKSSSLSKEVKAVYEARNFEPIWVGRSNVNRAKALVSSLKDAAQHGLPQSSYRVEEVANALKAARRNENAADVEVLATWIYVSYAQDMVSGVLEPRKVDKELDVSPPRRSEGALVDAVSKSSGPAFFRSLVPSHAEYGRLLSEKKRLEKLLGAGGFGPKVPIASLKLGSSSKNVVTMRNRLSAIGYGNLGGSNAFDEKLQKSVQWFQKDHGLSADGVAGPGTLKTMNASAQKRLQQVLVNLERERWMNRERGNRHIYVNLADFSFNVYDNDRVSFTSRTVVGKIAKDRTPEFHDEMTHMVVNPTWHVPRSITGKEYLPILRKDPGFLARRNMRLVTNGGKSVNPASVNFSKYNAKNFPYYIKQRPSKGNALGLVKFIFPNKHNIYLHDTPSKSLFNREVRAFSHGCVRVHKPFEFAYKLLEKQTSNPKGAFEAWLNTGREQYVNLEKPVPVYLDYRTAFFTPEGRVNYRNDIYGRDKKVFAALSKAGVALQAVQG